MDSVLRDWQPEALHLSFHSADFDVFIQARQNDLLLVIECPLAEASYKSDADPTIRQYSLYCKLLKNQTAHPTIKDILHLGFSRLTLRYD
jgi:hypothetical protein